MIGGMGEKKRKKQRDSNVGEKVFYLQRIWKYHS